MQRVASPKGEALLNHPLLCNPKDIFTAGCLFSSLGLISFLKYCLTCRGSAAPEAAMLKDDESHSAAVFIYTLVWSLE